MIPSQNEQRLLAISALEKEIVRKKEQIENACHRFEVLGSDTYIENGKVHMYPKGKAALTRLNNHKIDLARLERRLEWIKSLVK